MTIEVTLGPTGLVLVIEIVFLSQSGKEVEKLFWFEPRLLSDVRHPVTECLWAAQHPFDRNVVIAVFLWGVFRDETPFACLGIRNEESINHLNRFLCSLALYFGHLSLPSSLVMIALANRLMQKLCESPVQPLLNMRQAKKIAIAAAIVAALVAWVAPVAIANDSANPLAILPAWIWFAIWGWIASWFTWASIRKHGG